MTLILQNWTIPKTGPATAIDSTDPKPAPGQYAYQWVHLNFKDPGCRQWLIDDPTIDIFATDTLTSEDSRPRTITHKDEFLINLRGVNLNEGSDPTDMVGIRFYMSDDRLVSVERRPLKATRDMAALMTTNPPSDPAQFLAQFAFLLIERMGPVITEIDDRVGELEEQVDLNFDPSQKRAVADIRQDVIFLRRYLAPQRDALTAFANQPAEWIDDRDRLQIRSAADQATRVSEDLDALRERCGVIRDQLLDQQSEQMNTNMMVLSVVAAIFLPLGLVSGMMGINVGGMPWTETDMGFWYVTGLVVFIGIVQFLCFKWMKWI